MDKKTKQPTELDKHIKAATKAAFHAAMQYHKDNDVSMASPDFSLTVAARVLSIVLEVGRTKLGFDVADTVLNGIREELEEHKKNDVATH